MSEKAATYFTTEEYLKSLEEAAEPLIAWLDKYGHPHTSVHIEKGKVTVSEGRFFINFRPDNG